MKSSPVMLNNDLPSLDSGQIPWEHGTYFESYCLFHKMCREQDFPLLFCSPYDYDWETGELPGYWTPGDHRFIPVRERIRPMFIFDKCIGADQHCTAVIQQCEARGIPIFSPPDLGRLCNDKWRVYQNFKSYSPLTALLPQDQDQIIVDIHVFLDEMNRTYTDHDGLAIVKPLNGFQSRGIHLITRGPAGLEMHMLFGGQMHGADIERNLHSMAMTPYMIQAWVNTRSGIPGVGYEGEPHDLRFIFRVREPGVAEFIMLYVKTLHGMEYIPLDQLKLANPFQTVDPIADKLAQQFDYGIFSVDVMRDISGTWFLTEINDQVGLSINFDNPVEVHEMTRFMLIYIEEMKKLTAKSTLR